METQLRIRSSGAFTSHELYEYLLVVHPDVTVNNKIYLEKQNFHEQYGEKVIEKTKPYIAIADFVAREPMEQTIIRWLERICSSRQSFAVSLNNYSGFPPHTVYLRIQNPIPFKQLAHELKVIDNYVRSNDCPPAHLIKTPHLPIAGSLSKTVYEKALIAYSQKTFHETFTVDRLVLVKRCHQYDMYKPVNVFRLQPQQNHVLN
ncbi:MAG: 2-5 ligase family protein [Segetibacter sp.]|jgi:2'-5' RNA ligase|nr:2-5 ligase family protein [Segetibacter sp.]